jgi:hypothetical protein
MRLGAQAKASSEEKVWIGEWKEERGSTKYRSALENDIPVQITQEKHDSRSEDEKRNEKEKINLQSGGLAEQTLV